MVAQLSVYWSVDLQVWGQVPISTVHVLVCIERGGVVVERRTPNREVLGFYPHKRNCVVSLS